MLDRQLNAVLTVLNDFSDGAYKIIDADEIIAKLSDSDRCTKVELSGIIRTLSDNDYIKVKYSTVDEYCLATLAKARAIEKVEPHDSHPTASVNVPVAGEKGKSKEIKLDSISLRKMIRKAAFWGALLGGLIASAIALLIGVFLKMK